MTNIQSMMLAVCFGAVVGTLIGNILAIVKFSIDERREKSVSARKTKTSNNITGGGGRQSYSAAFSYGGNEDE
jgi:hypothetical protein